MKKKSLLCLVAAGGLLSLLAPAGVAEPQGADPSLDHQATGVITRCDDTAIIIKDGNKAWGFTRTTRADPDAADLNEREGTK